MSYKRKLQDIFECLTGFTIMKVANSKGFYNQDRLRSQHNHDFMESPRFCRAYNRGVRTCGQDYKWHWRVHVALWVASRASKLDGDFVECGVNKGFMASAIMTYLNWDSLGKTFYLMDTFCGVDERYGSKSACQMSKSWLKEGFYINTVPYKNFGDWENLKFVVGAIPETLHHVNTPVAYLHLDMNCAPPEVAALDYFWPFMVPGAFVLLDDFGYVGFEDQHKAMTELAQKMNIEILHLPTGQGLIVK